MLTDFASIEISMKNHHHNGPLRPTSRTLIHEAIATRAYALWVRYGRPENQADAIWLEAERDQVESRNAPQSDLAQPVSF